MPKAFPDSTIIIATAVTAAAMMIVFGAVPAVCAVLLALYVRERAMRLAAVSLLRRVALQLEDESAHSKRLEDILESNFIRRGLLDLFEPERSVH